jgi:hypothetical protein
MNIKWKRINRLDKDPVITGTSDEAPHLIFWKDKDGNVKSRLRKVAQEDNRAMNAEALAQYTQMQRERLDEITAELTQSRAIDPAYREHR